MLHKMALEIARRLATTEKGQKFLKGVLICALCFFTLIPVAVFAPIAAFVTGIDNFFSGEEGDDLDDTADLNALINGTFVITDTQYYKQIDKARSKHIKKIAE